jgi:histidinol-phosphate phosphatase family protein
MTRTGRTGPCGRRFAVLDRDGTVIEERHYLSDPNQVELTNNAARGLRRLTEMDLGLVVITNQSGIGRGYFDQESLDSVNQRVCDLLEAEGIQLSGIYSCPHVPQDDCYCRKPRTGLLEKAAAELHFDPSTCFVIGDKASDIELGKRVGATTFLVTTGYGAQVAQDTTAAPDYTSGSLDEVAGLIQGILEPSAHLTR